MAVKIMLLSRRGGVRIIPHEAIRHFYLAIPKEKLSMKKVSNIAVMPLALTVTGLIAVPSLAQQGGRAAGTKQTQAQIDRKLAKRAAIMNVSPAAIPTSAAIIPDEGSIAGAPFQNWTFEAPLFTGSPATPVAGQQGFTAFQGCTGALNTNTPVVTTAGTAMSGLQWVTVPKGPCAAGAFAGPFSPVTVQPAGAYTATVKLRVNDVLGADYDVVFQSPTQNNLVSRVKFYYADLDGDLINGDILVVTDPDGPGAGGAVFTNTGLEYVQGQLTTIKVEVNGPANTLKYYINNALVATSQLIYNGANAGDRFEQFVGISDNFQLNAVDNGQFDDATMEVGIGSVCLGNTNGDSNVDVNDLLAVITTWGPCPGCPPTTCAGDLNPPGGNCVIDVNDLLEVISHWGPCP
jgi:hypothetical protein